MARLPIRLFGDPVLRQRAGEVTSFDERLRTLAEDMLETMRGQNGAGLAANQVGILKRLFTWEAGEDFGAVVNPTITFESDVIQEGDEGCLSFPGLFYPTKRPLEVHIDAQDVHGEDISMEGEGLLARIIAHEIDHLNGILFIEHLERHDRKDAMKRIRRGELENPPPVAPEDPVV
ncbi:peptide deformylase [Euzebya tangerina]|uniref:peptide deformylase n=1 Tax=Euzebya tangerina TaxID=591198 RepID=UPI000E31C264|nr:peptide deformylase [Euzebya tangerina]